MPKQRSTSARNADRWAGVSVGGLEIIEGPAPLPHPEVSREPDLHGPLGLWRREAGRRIRLSDHDPVGAAYSLADEERNG